MSKKPEQKPFDLQMFNATATPTQTVAPVVTPVLEATPAPTLSYLYIRQGIAVNAFTKLGTKNNNNIVRDKISGIAKITSEDVILDLDEILLPNLRTSTHQLLDIFLAIFTQNGSNSEFVELTIDEYMKLRNLKNRKEAKKNLIVDVEVLKRATLTWNERKGKQVIPYASINISGGYGWLDKNRTNLQFAFGNLFYKVIKDYYLTPYPRELTEIDARRNPHSYYLGRKATEHKRMNAGKENEDIIAVKTLLASAPEIPSHQAVMTTNRNIAKRIIEPFERDLNRLSNTFTWEYCHSKGEPLTDAELANMDYETFESLLVRFYWKDYPDQSPRLERKAEHAEKAKARAEAKKKRAINKAKKEKALKTIETIEGQAVPID